MDEDPRSHTSLALLARIVAAVSLYPPEHPRVAEVVEPLRRAASAASAIGPLCIAASGRRDGEQPAVERLRRGMRALGIARVEILSDVSADDVVALARYLGRSVSRHAATDASREKDLSFLPPTVRVEERRAAAPFESPSSAADVDASQTSTDDEPLSDEERQLVETVRRVVLAALRAGPAAPSGPPTSPVPVERGERIAAVAEAVRRWFERKTLSAAALRSPAAVLAEAERSLPQILPDVDWRPVLDGIREALDAHLRAAFRAEPGTRDLAGGGGATDADASARDEVVRTLAELTSTTPEPGPVAPVERAEQISVLLHLLDIHVPDDVGDREGGELLGERLTAFLAEPLAPDEEDLFVTWLLALCSSSGPAEVDRRLAPVTAPRRGARAGSVARLLVAACNGAPRALAETLWPHLAYVLVTADGAQEGPAEEALVALVGNGDCETGCEGARRLAALVRRRVAPVATRIFDPPRATLHPLYAILTETPREAGFAGAVTEALLRQVASYPAAAALLVMDPAEQQTIHFVRRVLREGVSPSAAFCSIAAEILSGALRRAPPHRRSDAWVAKGVRALARLPCSASADMLYEIRRGNRLLWWRTWPPELRSAAAEATVDLQRRFHALRQLGGRTA